MRHGWVGRVRRLVLQVEIVWIDLPEDFLFVQVDRAEVVLAPRVIVFSEVIEPPDSGDRFRHELRPESRNAFRHQDCTPSQSACAELIVEIAHAAVRRNVGPYPLKSRSRFARMAIGVVEVVFELPEPRVSVPAGPGIGDDAFRPAACADRHLTNGVDLLP